LGPQLGWRGADVRQVGHFYGKNHDAHRLVLFLPLLNAAEQRRMQLPGRGRQSYYFLTR
jgi:hypothetical protein